CGLQNLVRPPQLTVLPLQFGDPLRVAGRGPGALPAIDLDLPDPGPQRLTVHAELVGHPGDRAGLHTGLFTQLKHHPDRAFTQLWGVLPRGCHSPSPFQVSGPPPKPGRSTWWSTRCAGSAPPLSSEGPRVFRTGHEIRNCQAAMAAFSCSA